MDDKLLKNFINRPASLIKEISKKNEDPMSHRIIEKRRRDRMNNCLADLSRLIPAEYVKKGRGRIEKTEIIEMAIKRVKYLQDRVDQIENFKEDPQAKLRANYESSRAVARTHYQMGYQECLTEVMRFLVEIEGFYPTDTICAKLVAHLEGYFEKIASGEYKQPELDYTKESHAEPMQPGNYCNKMDYIPTIYCKKERGNYHSSSSSENGSLHSVEDTNNRFGSELMSNTSSANSLYVPQTPYRDVSPSSCSPRTDSGFDSHSGGSSMYKFKTDIKERFAAEHNQMLVNSVKRRRQSIDSSASNADSHTIKSVSKVPIFALNPRNTHYIPLTIDSHLLEPFIHDNSDEFSILHPVTISVNFQPQCSQLQTLNPCPMDYSHSNA